MLFIEWPSYEEAIKAYDRVIEIVPPYLTTACERA